jgi:DNA-binding LacI/PurR family transcriptional regulator
MKLGVFMEWMAACLMAHPKSILTCINVTVIDPVKFPPQLMKPIPTQADIAKALSVSKATISMALRNDPRISAEIRKKVVDYAEKMGYRPNPMLAALGVTLRSGKKDDAARIALVGGYPFDDVSRSAQTRRFLDGLRARADHIGYKLEEFWLKNLAITERGLQRILLARGLHGVIFAFFDPDKHLDMDWEHFSAVSTTFNIAGPALHVVGCDYYDDTVLAVEKLEHLGYRSIGIVMARFIRGMVHNLYRSAVFALRDRPENSTRIEFLELESGLSEEEECRLLAAWVRKAKLDVVLALDEDRKQQLLASGLAVPGNVAFACLDLQRMEDKTAGIRQNYEAVTAAAVDLVAEQLQNNQCGLPTTPRQVLVGGHWHDGTTAPRKIAGHRHPPHRASSSRSAPK